MSYSFSITASSKDEAKQKIAEQMDAVVLAQPPHAADRDAAVATGCAFVDLVMDVPEDRVMNISMHGSVSWILNDPHALTGSNVGFSCHFLQKPVA